MKDNGKPVDYYSFLSNKHWLADPIQSVFMSGPRKNLFKTVIERKPKNVLDICCGTAVMANWFTSRGLETTGVDSSETMLNRASLKGRLTHSILLDVSQLQFQNEFDAVYVNLAIHEMSPDVREHVWRKMLQAVRDGGLVVVMDLCKPQKNTRLARFWHRFFEMDERNFLTTNPDHYKNYCEFIEHGGLRSWMTQRVAVLHSEEYFFAENIGVLSAVVNKSGESTGFAR